MRVAFVNMSAVEVGAIDTSRRRFGSDEIGFGVTSARVLREALGCLVEVIDVATPPSTDPDPAAAKLDWIYRQYDELRQIVRDVDAVLVFHISNTFAGEVRRMLIELSCDIPLVGYTHGSHWDPTDLYRFEFYDGLEYVDLGNLTVLDRVLLVSDTIRTAILASLADLNRRLAERLAPRCRVVGLPVDLAGIDAARAVGRPRESLRLVFNHSFTTAKRPEIFLDLCPGWLASFPDLHVDITRRPSLRFEPTVQSLVNQFPTRVHVWNDLPTDRYQALLTGAAVQVSCATHESFGVSTVEAMYAGACAVAPNIGAYPELMRGIDGALYDGSPDQLDERVSTLLADEHLRRTIAAQQRRRASQFSGPRVAEAVVDVLSEPAKERG